MIRFSKLLTPTSTKLLPEAAYVMRISFHLSAMILALLPTSLWAQDVSKNSESLSAASLNERDLIGALGIPLGQVTEITATIVSGDDLKMKAHAGQYLLSVGSVGGTSLDKPPTIRFVVHFLSKVRLATDRFSLYELENARKARSLDSSQVTELEKGYKGRTVKLLVYETGSFIGMPYGLPEGYPQWQDTGFHFSTRLVVLRNIDLP